MGTLMKHDWAQPSDTRVTARMRHNYLMLADPHYRLRVYENRVASCRRALGIVNRLPPGPYKAKHASRIMATLNRTRALVLEERSSVVFLERVVGEFKPGRGQ